MNFHYWTKESIFDCSFSTGYITNDLPEKAIDLFAQVEHPSDIVINLLFNACAQQGTEKALNLVNQVRSTLPASSYANVRLLTSLLDALMKCGDVASARSLFDASKTKDVPMYGAMMKGNSLFEVRRIHSIVSSVKGYVTNTLADKAIDLFNQIARPNEVIINLLFNACAQLETPAGLNLVKQVQSKLPASSHANVWLVTSLLDALMQCGDTTSARSLFTTLPKKTLSMYAAMMKGKREAIPRRSRAVSDSPKATQRMVMRTRRLTFSMKFNPEGGFDSRAMRTTSSRRQSPFCA